MLPRNDRAFNKLKLAHAVVSDMLIKFACYDTYIV